MSADGDGSGLPEDETATVVRKGRVGTWLSVLEPWQRLTLLLLIGLPLFAGFLLVSFLSFPVVRIALGKFVPGQHMRIQSRRNFMAATDQKPQISLHAGGCDHFRIKVFRRRPELFSASADDSFLFENSRLPCLPLEYLKPLEQLPPADFETAGRFIDLDFYSSEALAELPQLPAGDYVFVAEGERGHGALTAPLAGSIRVSDLVLLVQTMGERYLVKTINIRSLKPVPAKIQMLARSIRKNEEDRARKLMEVVTGADGCAVMVRPAGIFAEEVCFVASDAGHKAWFSSGRQDERYGYREDSCTAGTRHFPKSITDLTTDRTVYRLGQHVLIKGVVRELAANGLINPPSGQSVQISLQDPQGKRIQSTYTKTGIFGDFDGQFTLPEDGRTGSYYIGVTTTNGDLSVKTLEVMQYRKPEFEVSVTPVKPVTMAGEKIKFKVCAKYLFGAPVANALVDYQAHRELNYQVRSGLKEAADFDKFFEIDPPVDVFFRTGLGRWDGTALTDATGEALIELDGLTPSPESGPSDAGFLEENCVLRARVTDISHKEEHSEGVSLVSAGDFALLLDLSQRFAIAGDEVNAAVRALTYDRKPAGNVHLVASLEHWQMGSNGQYRDKKVLQEQLLRTDAAGGASIAIKLDGKMQSGSYFLTVQAKDSAGRLIKDCQCLAVCAKDVRQHARELAPALSVDLDKPIYKPGDTVRALVRLPGRGCKSGLLTLHGSSLWKYQNLEIDQDHCVVEIPLKKEYAPRCDLSVSFVNADRRLSQANVPVYIYPEPFILKVDIQPDRQTYRPGQKAHIRFVVKKNDGTPAANTRLIASITDQALQSIVKDSHNICKSFYGFRDYPYESSWSFRTDEPCRPPSLSLLDLSWMRLCAVSVQQAVTGDATVIQCGSSEGAPALQGATNGTLAAGELDRGACAAVTTRKNFQDLAYWSGLIKTDQRGIAEIDVKLPDDLTTWRIDVSALSREAEFGSRCANIVASKEIVARLAAPRFYTANDEGFLTGIVHNYSNTQQKVHLSIAASNHLALESDLEHDLVIPPQELAQYRWPVKVKGSGAAHIELKALAQTDSDAIKIRVPVRSLSYPAFATKNGIIQDAVSVTSLPLKLTSDAQPGSGQFALALCSSSLGPVLKNFDKLVSYANGSTEQTISSLIPSVVAMQLHRKLSLPLNRDELFDKVRRKSFIKLAEYQNGDGGWGWWPSDATNPYLTAYVMEGLFLLRQAGYNVDQSMIDSGLHCLERLFNDAGNAGDLETLTDQAYLMYVGSLWHGKLSALKTEQISVSKMAGPEALSYLVLALKQQSKDHEARLAYDRLLGLAQRSGSFTTWEHTAALLKKLRQGKDYTYRFTGAETTALALQAVLAIEPANHQLLSSIKNWLLAQRDENGWANTKTTARVFLALLEEELTARKAYPVRYSAIASEGGKTLASFTFDEKNRYAAEQMLQFPVRGGENELVLRKRGSGPLYYSSILEYQRPIKPGKEIVSLSTPPDLSIERKFYRLEQYIDGKTKERSVRAVDLKGAVKTGEVLLMEVIIDSPVSLPYVKVDASLPSGAEVVTREEAKYSSRRAASSDDTDPAQANFWWSHRDILDDRIAFFSTQIPAGRSRFEALIRMEVPGQFNLNPVSFQGMYTKAIRGYSTADRLTVIE